ncbi:methyltransferase [Marinobacterium rhizophilum]|uniref:Class I SAM-dependent methyltransferase n=1 Tax=Marinobacterium rhizophilum TaxID=420402 RepID=A0ABY5HF27_9GAMM|nr:methyltransferase [Marinobacterium rhizophilum]UTW10885.1 class I SAM-dependent methyltransferase [Marinobacterium rhizophilum]
MIDPAFNLLLPHIQGAPPQSLWLADENLLGAQLAPRSNIRMIANRLDLVQAARARGWQADWSDFDLSAIPAGSIARVIYRVSKEKPLVHHNINQALRVLRTGGELMLSGDKGEGIKGYLERTRTLFAGQGDFEKASANCWLGVFTRPEQPGLTLDDKNYAQLREACADTQFQYWSKPGVFGWDKIDKGSAFLIEHLDTFVTELPAPPARILDLGCGYGYLSLQAARLGAPVTATDNNAAAIAACERNFAAHGIRGEVIPASCGDGIDGPFELILCNPPFHAGFSVEDDLTERFLSAAARLLARNGIAAFVVNRQIMLERRAASRFARIQTLAENRSFKLVLLAGAKTGA